MGFSRKAYWSGLPFPTPGELPHPGIEPTPLVPPALAGGLFTTEPPGKPLVLTSTFFYLELRSWVGGCRTPRPAVPRGHPFRVGSEACLLSSHPREIRFGVWPNRWLEILNNRAFALTAKCVVFPANFNGLNMTLTPQMPC